MRSRACDPDLRERAGRTRNRGAVLLALAALLWTWCAVLFLTHCEADRVDHQQPTECEPRLPTERGTPDDGLFHPDHCAKERDWPQAPAVLGLSVPVAEAGAVVLTVGILGRRMSAHGQAMREPDRTADAREALDKACGGA